MFFIHSSADGCFGCFHVLATVNSATMNTEVHVSFRVIVFSGSCPGVGVLFLVFERTSTIFSIVVVPMYIHTNRVGGFVPFLICKSYLFSRY